MISKYHKLLENCFKQLQNVNLVGAKKNFAQISLTISQEIVYVQSCHF
jgi:hypothetical protein